MISVSFSRGFSPPLFWWKGSELSGLTAQMSSLFRAKMKRLCLKRRRHRLLRLSFPWEQRVDNAGYCRWKAGLVRCLEPAVGPLMDQKLQRLHLCAGEVETGSKVSRWRKVDALHSTPQRCSGPAVQAQIAPQMSPG